MQRVIRRTEAHRVSAPRAIAVAVAAIGLLSGASALGEICKYQDAEGMVHYSNLPPEKGWKQLHCEESSTDSSTKKSGSGSKANSTRSASPTNFPRVDATTQRGRDDMRRKVLMDELKTEEKLLEEARTSYAAGVKPEADEKSGDDRYRARVDKLRQVIGVHQKNIDALRKEIGGLK